MQPARLEGARPVGGGAPPGQTRPARPPVRLSRRGTRTCAASFSRDESRQGPAAAARGAPSGAEQSRLARLLSRQADAAPEGAVLARPAAAGAIRRVAATVATNTADEEEQAVAEAALLLQQQQQQPGEGREVQVDAQPKQQPAQHQVEAPAAAAEQSGAFSLYSWLTWGSSGSPAAAATGSGSDAEDGVTEVEGVAQLADGMATAPSSDTIGSSSSSSSWRRWYGLGRAARGGSGSFDDGEATPQRWQQSVPVDHPALQLLRQRALAGSRPGQRRDHFKLGLVVEGGGMRGCVSGGSLQALTDLGLRECFDAVYGSSAGAINSTYFLSGQRTGVDIYHQHIACPEFINLRRLRWRGGAGAGASSGSLSSVDEEPTPVLNLSFLIDHVMDSVHPLDWDAVLASPVPLKVVASSLDSLNPVLLHSFEGRDDLAQCLKASATVPEIAGGPRLHRGHRLVDAAVFEPVPFRSAIADGCTHLLVLCTRPVPLTRRSRVNSYLSDAVEVAIKKAVLSPDYMVPAWKAELEYLSKDGLTQDDQLLKAATQPDAHELPWFAGTHVLPLYPGAAANFSPLCIDPPTLRGGVAEGRRNVLAVCRALLGDAWDFSRFPELESSNIVPTRSPSSSSARLWRRYFADDFSTHA